MAGTQVILKVSPLELQVIRAALVVYGDHLQSKISPGVIKLDEVHLSTDLFDDDVRKGRMTVGRLIADLGLK